jgi:hypothetical protein
MAMAVQRTLYWRCAWDGTDSLWLRARWHLPRASGLTGVYDYTALSPVQAVPAVGNAL